MRMKHIGARLAVAAVTGALVAAPQAPAFAATAAAPTISITAKSALPKITGDVLVVWRSSAKSATISGSITNGVAGEIVKLYAQQFPFKNPAAPIGTPITLSTTGTSPYSFTATPTLATRYRVKLFASDGVTVLATSTRVTVYVASNAHISGFRPCSRPTCHERFHIRVLVPASTLRTEKGKKWYEYFGIRFSRTGIPRPRILTLGAGHPHFSPARKLNSHEFAVSLTFSFFVGNHGYNFLFFPCQRDTEAKDGLNLPGHHGCGTLRSISSHRIYLG
jgi:hypothetical protein